MSVPLIAELKRRRVFRALFGYAIVAFAVLQVIEPVMHGLRLPEWTFSFVVVALAIGFPVVLVLAALANVDGLRVVSRTSAFAYKNKNLSVRQIGEELAVATVLERSVWREGSALRLTAQLINAADGYHLWSRTYERELKSVFALEDEVAHSIADALRPRLLHQS
jgi:hypothetical protein